MSVRQEVGVGLAQSTRVDWVDGVLRLPLNNCAGTVIIKVDLNARNANLVREVTHYTTQSLVGISITDVK